MRNLASKILGVPVRIAQPENLVGMTDRLNSPAFSTSVGLLRWGLLMSEVVSQGGQGRHGMKIETRGVEWRA